MMSKKEFYQFLETKGGLIYSHGKPSVPIYLFGIECDDGWLEMISELIQELIEAGWTRETTQIKEKFGGLSFYAEGMNDECWDIIMKYEARSFTVCETCGSKNNVQLRNDRWFKTLCDQCAVTWLERHKR